MKHGTAAGGAIAAVLALPVGLLLAVPALFADASPANAASCAGAAVSVNGALPATVAGYPATPSLAGAAEIMQAAKDKGLDQRAQLLGVMVSMGESGLTPVNHGDVAGPNSRGWFQQRDWGPVADELDPYKSALMFYGGGQHGEPGLTSVAGWQSMTPTQAAHAVQRNADPNFYTKFWPAAVQVVAALSGVSVTGGCAAAGVGAPVGADGVAVPAHGTLSSGFADRINPVTGAAEHHNGQDIAAPCGTPIYAAMAGVVTRAGPATGFGNAIYLDHGNGLVTWYGHEFDSGLLVHQGDHVTAGQQIGLVGKNGQATGCHLHFEVHVDGVAVDPVPWMAAHGAPLG